MHYLSVCSGIEAASVAWKPLGWTAAAFAEGDPFCCALLKQRYPDVPNLGDIAADDFGERATALGNSIVTEVLRWIGNRTDMVEHLLSGGNE